MYAASWLTGWLRRWLIKHLQRNVIERDIYIILYLYLNAWYVDISFHAIFILLLLIVFYGRHFMLILVF